MSPARYNATDCTPQQPGSIDCKPISTASPDGEPPTARPQPTGKPFQGPPTQICPECGHEMPVDTRAMQAYYGHLGNKKWAAMRAANPRIGVSPYRGRPKISVKDREIIAEYFGADSITVKKGEIIAIYSNGARIACGPLETVKIAVNQAVGLPGNTRDRGW